MPSSGAFDALRYNVGRSILGVETILQELSDRLKQAEAKITELEKRPVPLPPVSIKRARIYVPLFMWPYQTVNGARIFSPHWQAVIDAKKAFPDVEIYCCINENNGDYSGGRMLWTEAQFNSMTPNPDILRGVAALEAAGIKIGVYTYTDYRLRPVEIVAQRIRYARAKFPSAKFIFLDEQDSKLESISYYQGLTTFAKAQGFEFTIGNPGTGIPQAAVGACDVTMIYESAGLCPYDLINNRTFGLSKEKFGCFPHSVPTYDSAWVKHCMTKLAFVYATDDSTDSSISPDRDVNPWNTTSKHLLSLCADALASGDTN